MHRHLLPTPVAGEGRHGGPQQTHGQGGPSLSATAALLPTPMVSDTQAEGPADMLRKSPQLRAVEHLLPTPLTQPVSGNGHARDLGAETRLLPTPVCTDAKHAGASPHTGDTLTDAARADRWGAYADAVARWEQTSGAPAPDATEPGKHGQPRLSAPFVEWMMGLPPGHVTDVPGVGRNAQLKALGNGVVPQQAALGVAAILASLPPAALARLR